MEKGLLGAKYELDRIDEELGDDFWKPRDVAHFNDWVLRASAVKGEYHWHTHGADEFFLIYRGEIVIDTEDGSIPLSEGEGAVVPKGVRHRPRAEERALVLVLEPASVNPLGD